MPDIVGLHKTSALLLLCNRYVSTPCVIERGLDIVATNHTSTSHSMWLSTLHYIPWKKKEIQLAGRSEERVGRGSMDCGYFYIGNMFGFVCIQEQDFWEGWQ